MIELTEGGQLGVATAQARAAARNWKIHMTGVSREYRVVNPKNGLGFTVTFRTGADGKRFGHCSCAAGVMNRLCRHIEAAASSNIYLEEKDLTEGRQQRAS